MEWSESVVVDVGPVNTGNNCEQFTGSHKSAVEQYSDEAVERNRQYIDIG